MSSSATSSTSTTKAAAQKEPVAMFWIIIGLLLSVAAMIGIERLIPRY